jgi:hypothetical protein
MTEGLAFEPEDEEPAGPPRAADEMVGTAQYRPPEETDEPAVDPGS